MISNYESNIGKSGGEFFTPQIISKLIARLVIEGKTNINKMYYSACESHVVIITTTNSKYGYWVSITLIKEQNMNWSAV